MREIEFKAVFDGEKYVLPQDMKYRVKNRISEKTMSKTAKPFVKRSVSAMVSIVLASILVITAAAVGGAMLFQSIYGDNIEPIMPYSEQINLTTADENYELTLHEAVADEYTTAYIFSVKRLTVGASRAVENGSTMIFNSYRQINSDADDTLKYTNPQENPAYFTAFNGYDIFNHQIYQFERLVLIRTNTAYDAENGARYLIRTIDNLKTEDTDYYALYVINGEDQTLNIGVSPYSDIYGGLNGRPYRGLRGGPEITLPKVTQKAPSVTRSVQEYYRQYLKQTDPTVLFGSRRLADSVTVTPLAVYVGSVKEIMSIGWNGSVRYVGSVFYRTAELVFNDGTEKILSEMSQDEAGIMISDTTGVFLFNEILDTAQVKSFLVYDTVEFPMDEKLPVIDRETGTEIIPKYETMDLLFDIGTNLSDYLDSAYPDERKKGCTYCGSPNYFGEGSCRIQGLDCSIILTGYDKLEGETFSEAANRLLEENRTKHSWVVSNMTTKDGTCSLGDVKYAEVSFSIMGGNESKMHIFFFEKDGKLITLQLNEKENVWPYYSLDALLKLITFN